MEKISFSKINKFYIGIAFVVLVLLTIIIIKGNPPTLILPVPFSVQAPSDNWSRNEDCEEISVIMANAFLNGITDDKLPTANLQEYINSVRAWENANLGYNKDTGADATTKIAESGFGLKIKQIKDFTKEDLKAELIKGHPILLPINAKLLESPQYLENGPTYHMIVVRGFKGDVFIVNDPGTESGNGQKYPFSILQKASADWDHVTKTINSDRKIALVVSK